MSSPISFGGFNNIDFNQVVNILMAQEQLPRQIVADQQTTLKTQSSALAALSAKLTAVATASAALAEATAASARQATSTDDTIVSASAASDAGLGIFEIVVSKLAQSQVSASSQQNDKATTVVADSGILTIGGVDVDVTGKSLTLEGLADAINGTTDIGVTATIVSPESGKYQLVLTGKDTGDASAFTITSTLKSGGVDSAVTFAAPARLAADAELTVNDVAIKSATNTVDGAVPGTTLTLLRKSTDVVSVVVSQDTNSTKALVQKFVDTYNDLVSTIQQQSSGSGALGGDPLTRSLWTQLRGAINGTYTAGGTQSNLPTIGVEFDRSGKLTLNATTLAEALTTHQTDVGNLFGGDGVNDGIFSTLHALIDSYSSADGLISNNQTRLKDRVARMDQQLADMDDRLATRRAALQREFAAADSLMSQLNSQSGSLSGLSSQYKLF